jgi:hypothetical protein
LEVICGWANNFGDEGSFPEGRELMHAVGLLDASEDEVTNVEGSFINIVIRDGNGDPIPDSPRGIPLLGDGDG